MIYNDDEEKYKDLIDQLKSLKQIQAPENFHPDLMRRINSETISTQRLVLGTSFINARVVPAIAAGIALIVIIFLFNYNRNEPGNPLLAEPQVRKDMITSSNLSGFLQNESLNLDKSTGSKNLQSPNNLPHSESNKTSGKMSEENQQSLVERQRQKQSASLALFQGNGLINKSGLNFRQINLLPAERIQVKKLKEKMEKLFYEDSKMNGK